ncbi:unnamed protein product, partial [Scytosiphon promiscuus]
RRHNNRQSTTEEATCGRGAYAQPKVPQDQYVGDFDEIPMGLPGSVPCGPRTCCCCLNAGEFETISKREEPSRAPCCPRPRRNKDSSQRGDRDAGTAAVDSNPEKIRQAEATATASDHLAEHNRRGRVPLGEEGWRVCLTMLCFPWALPWRACTQHKNITELYPVESTTTQKSGLCGRIKATVLFPWMLAKHVAFVRERRWADELRYPWQTRAVWTVAGRPPSALFKVLILGDNGVGKTALARALCGKGGLLPEYTPGTAVSVSARSFSRENYPPAVLEIWDVPASAKTTVGTEMVTETSCALLLLDLDDRNSLRVAKRWQALITEACSGSKEGPPQFIVVGTKIDVTPASNCAFFKEAQLWCESNGAPLLFCTSFTGEGIMGLLRQIIVLCYDRHPPPAFLKEMYN